MTSSASSVSTHLRVQHQAILGRAIEACASCGEAARYDAVRLNLPTRAIDVGGSVADRALCRIRDSRGYDDHLRASAILARAMHSARTAMQPRAPLLTIPHAPSSRVAIWRTPRGPRRTPCIDPSYSVSRIHPRLSRIAPSVSRIHPRLSRIAPSVSRIHPRLSRIAPSVSRNHPRLSRIAPTSRNHRNRCPRRETTDVWARKRRRSAARCTSTQSMRGRIRSRERCTLRELPCSHALRCSQSRTPLRRFVARRHLADSAWPTPNAVHRPALQRQPNSPATVADRSHEPESPRSHAQEAHL